MNDDAWAQLWRNRKGNDQPLRSTENMCDGGDAVPFEEVVHALEARARHLLNRESMVGRSRHVTGRARLRDEELVGRLARLHGHVRDCAKAAQVFSPGPTSSPEAKALFTMVDGAATSLAGKRFSRMADNSLEDLLTDVWSSLAEGLDLLGAMVADAAMRLDPGARLDLLTPEEVEATFEDTPEVMDLAAMLRLQDDLQHGITEARAILAGRFHGPETTRGRQEQRRGRWIAAHLLGIAEGMGLKASRNHTKREGAPRNSAADAVAMAIGRLQPKPLADHVARAVRSELPRNRDGEFDTRATTEAIMRKLVQSKDAHLEEPREVGRLVGHCLRA